MQAYGKAIDETRLKEVEEAAGHGISAVLDGQRILAGNDKLMKSRNVEVGAVE